MSIIDDMMRYVDANESTLIAKIALPSTVWAQSDINLASEGDTSPHQGDT
jgi:hypothetical protein